MFKKVCIIGCGLIGSSLARAIKKIESFTAITRTYKENSKRVWKVKRGK